MLVCFFFVFVFAFSARFLAFLGSFVLGWVCCKGSPYFVPFWACFVRFWVLLFYQIKKHPAKGAELATKKRANFCPFSFYLLFFAMPVKK